MENKINFFELLILNCQEDIKDYLIANGKAPKAVCPIRFINKDEEVIPNGQC